MQIERTALKAMALFIVVAAAFSAYEAVKALIVHVIG